MVGIYDLRDDLPLGTYDPEVIFEMRPKTRYLTIMAREPNLAVIVADIFEKLFKRCWPKFGRVVVTREKNDRYTPSWIEIECRIFGVELFTLEISEEEVALDILLAPSENDRDDGRMYYGGSYSHKRILAIPLMDPNIWEKITIGCMEAAKTAKLRNQQYHEYELEDSGLGLGDPFFQSRSIVHKDEI